jgi:hypothetical protein
MKRWYLAAVAGLWSFAPVSAQEGSLAPTAPVVPTPVLQNGSLSSPSGGGNGGASSRMFAPTKWSPFRNPATASVTEPITPSAASYSHALPPLPAGIGVVDGSGGAAGCGTGGCSTGAGHNRACWERMKAWMCFHPSKTGLPKLQPTPYQTPLLGMFPCGSGPGGCAAVSTLYPPVAGQLPLQAGYPGQPPGQPLGQPQPYTPPMGQPMPQPGAGAVMMPPRGAQGAALQPTWQGRVTPAPADPGIAGYRFASPAPVVPTGLQMPAPK